MLGWDVPQFNSSLSVGFVPNYLSNSTSFFLSSRKLHINEHHRILWQCIRGFKAQTRFTYVQEKALFRRMALTVQLIADRDLNGHGKSFGFASACSHKNPLNSERLLISTIYTFLASPIQDDFGSMCSAAWTCFKALILQAFSSPAVVCRLRLPSSQIPGSGAK